jgi:hypothetical protein
MSDEEQQMSVRHVTVMPKQLTMKIAEIPHRQAAKKSEERLCRCVYEVGSAISARFDCNIRG